MKNMTMAIVSLVFVLTGCAHENRFMTKDGDLRDGWTSGSDRKYVRTVGLGVSPDKVKSTTRRRGMARNAALVSARTEMIALLRGVRIKGHVEVSGLAQQRDGLRELVDAVLSQAEEESVQFTADDGAIVVLRLERRKVQKMLRDATKTEADSEEAIAALEKQIAVVDSRSRAMLTIFPGMKAE